MNQRLQAIWVIAHRELRSRARSKAFRISSALLLLGMVLGIAIPAFAMRNANRYAVVVVAQPAALAQAITAQSAAAGLTVTVVAAPSRAMAASLVDAGNAAAAVIGDQEVIWKNTENARLSPVIGTALAQVAIGERARALGLTPGQLRGLLAPPRPVVTRLHAQPDRTPQTIVALIGMVLLFVALNFYGNYVLTGVVEEKSSRVVEVLLARVRPADLLAGKVVGIGILGISQFAALAVVAAVTMKFTRPLHLPAGTLPVIATVVLWFILGYAFYSVLYGALGALASRTEDAQAAAAPLTAFMLLVYFGAFAIMANPAAWWVTAGSLFPPTAPIFMPVRAALTDVPAWQMAAAVLLMAVATMILIRIGGRLYRGAVLHTAGRVRIRQAWQGSVT
jgi:ABC-2 type transport system permease protein